MADTTTEDAQAQGPEADGVDVQEAELPQAEAGIAPAAGGHIGVLLDTTLSIDVRLGEVETRARELLCLGAGSVLQLDKRVGEPLELYLRGKRFATGELVVVGERLGVRIKEIVSAEPAPQAAEEPT